MHLGKFDPGKVHIRWRQDAKRSRGGVTIIEVTLASLVALILMLATSVAFSGNLKAVDRAREMTTASLFMETTLEEVSAQSFNNVLAMNGNNFFSHTDASDSDYSIALTVFVSEPGLLQVQAVMTELSSGRELGRITTLRSRA